MADELTRMNCAVDATMAVIEGRWKSIIICKLAHIGPLRFNQLIREIDGVSPRILTKQLKELESDGIVNRVSYPEIPPKVEYSLTDKGRSLGPIFLMMRDWGLSHQCTNLVRIDGCGPGD